MFKINHQNNYQGFTLLEVMVALMIIAIVLLSLLRITALQANHLQYLEQKNIAQWVALDVIAKMQAGQISIGGTPGTLQGSTTQLNYNWYWQVKFSPTADPHALQAQIDVKSSLNGNPLVHFVTYFSTTG